MLKISVSVLSSFSEASRFIENKTCKKFYIMPNNTAKCHKTMLMNDNG